MGQRQRREQRHHSAGDRKGVMFVCQCQGSTEAICVAVQVALKCADIGHLAASPGVHKRWALLLEEEFFLQVSSSLKKFCKTQE